jgi:uncharacterized protein (DUF1499 family)
VEGAAISVGDTAAMRTRHRPLTALFALLPWVAAQAAALGTSAGALQPCPASPNCVCSCSSNDDAHHTKPLHYSGDATLAWQALRRALASMDRARIVSDDGSYMHVEFTTALFRFVDDVELLSDPQAAVIHIRSASRVGYYDLGTNRRRVEAIRARFDHELTAVSR